ncbi:MAG: amino acid ABC transporter ATP-binding protein [Rubrivivax sp.]
MEPAPTPILKLSGLRKSFGPHEVLKGIDLQVLPGERIAVIGGSGSGKSTALRCINLLEHPTQGRIELDGRPVGTPVRGRDGAQRIDYAERELCDVRKRVGMVFQQFNLFPHMTVLQNTMEGLLTVKGMGKAAARQVAEDQLRKVGLDDKFDVYPSRLSGGQQQRVAIARALAMQPEVLLFDEPTSSLDPALVGEVLRVIRALADEGRTMILVTHEFGFAYRFATRVLFLADGVIHEEGTPEQIFKAPKRDKTREFIRQSAEFAL